MRELKQDWRDIFGSFRVAFDVWKLLLGFLGVVTTVLVLWGLTSIPENVAGWVLALIIAGILWLGLVIKFAMSDTGFTVSKIVMLAMVGVVLAGAVLLCVYTDQAKALGRWGGLWFVVLAIWAFFGGAAGFACKKYGSYLGATLLPALAIIFLALSCAFFGLLLRVPYVNFLVTLVFFVLVVLAGFLMTLVTLGGIAGAPLMYPAVSSEGNDSFDAISRAYSYVFGRPCRYLFYNGSALIYGLACAFFVAFFAKFMLVGALMCVNYGSGPTNREVAYPEDQRPPHYFEDQILPRVQTLLIPLVGMAEKESSEWKFETSTPASASAPAPTPIPAVEPVPPAVPAPTPATSPVVASEGPSLRAVELVDEVGSWFTKWDVTSLVSGAYSKAKDQLGLEGFTRDTLDLGWTEATTAVLMVIGIYIVAGLVLAYVLSLFFSMQTTIYLLLRKNVDGAEMTEVYREEEEEDYLSVAPEGASEGVEGEKKAGEEDKSE